MSANVTFYSDLIRAFLHDPPDKALEIKGHENRAARYLSEALGIKVDREDVKLRADGLAARTERLPAPDWTKITVGPEDGLQCFHPLCARKWRELKSTGLREQETQQVIRELAKSIANEDDRQRFFALWRLLPERLELVDSDLAWLPADTRNPDHTIWHHLDTTAAHEVAEGGNGHGAALLSFALGPVQGFIAAARSVRDLRLGSLILAWTAFQGMLPVIEQCGPTALLYPSLRGLPFLDLWLRAQGDELKGIIKPPACDLRSVPCLPNRFLALVPYEREGMASARELAKACEERAAQAWFDIAKDVHGTLKGRLTDLDPSKRWQTQVESFFDFRTAVLPFKDCSGKLLESLICSTPAPEVRDLARLMCQRGDSKYSSLSGEWAARVELSSRLMESSRSIRRINENSTYDAEQRFPGKCSLLGSLEQMGPNDLGASREFWDKAAKAGSIKGARIRTGERLSAVSLVKRFSHVHFTEKFDLQDNDFRFPDTATIAAAHWLEAAGIDPGSFEAWSGQWLHWSKRDFDKNDPCPQAIWDQIQAAKIRLRDEYGSPPTYYAVLVMDGDDMGDWLRGEKSPSVGEVLHPKMLEYFQGLGEAARPGIDAKRPLGPALHAAMSEALANFALKAVPGIVASKDYRGVVVYSGGDDTLALLPSNSALACALSLVRAFQGTLVDGAPDGWLRANDRDLLMMGPGATLSGGLALVHYKYDLRLALDAARSAEKAAKNAGKDALGIKVCRRSGGHSLAICPWNLMPWLEGLVEAFRQGASDRFAYHLARERQTLKALPIEAMAAEVSRLVGRAERDSLRKLTGIDESRGAGAVAASWLEDYCRAVRAKQMSDADALRGFVVLCQAASFLARGRDE